MVMEHLQCWLVTESPYILLNGKRQSENALGKGTADVVKDLLFRMVLRTIR